MLSDPTYDAQIRQFDHRWTVGGKGQREFFSGQKIELMAGTELRYDDAGRVGVDNTDGGIFVSNQGSNSIREGSVAGYSEATWHATDSLRLTGGLRADYYHFNASANAGAGPSSAAGSDNDSRVSPKVVWPGRSATSWSSMETGAAAFIPTMPVVSSARIRMCRRYRDLRGTGKEGGLRFELGKLKLTTTYWWLDVDSELIFVGDSNAVEPKSGGKRRGLELVAFWKPVDWLDIDAVFTHSHARYKEDQEDPDFDASPTLPLDPGAEDPRTLHGLSVEGSVESAGELGISAVRGAWEVSGRLRYLGPYPLVPSNTKRADSEAMVNLRLAYKFGHATLYGELLNVLDDKGNDIRYYYPTFVPGVSNPGEEITTYLSRSEEPRTLRVGVKYTF